MARDLRNTPIQATRGHNPNVAKGKKQLPKIANKKNLREQFDGFPIPTYVWKHDGHDFVLADYNLTADLASRGRVAGYVGKTARDVYQDRLDILEQIMICFQEHSNFVKEMAYAIPNTDETYHLRVYYVSLPPDRVMVLTEDNTVQVRAKEEAERRANEFHVLYENSRALGLQFDLPFLLDTTVDGAIALLDTQGGALFFNDPEHNDLPIAVWRGPQIPSHIRLSMGESVAGQVALTHEPMIVNDYPNWEYRSTQFEWLNLKAVLGVPLLFAGELIGVLVVMERGESTRQFTERDIHLLSLFASQVASAIRNVRVYNDMRRSLAELEAVSTISKALRAAEDLNEMLTMLLDEILKVINTDSGIIWLYEPKKGYLARIVARGWFQKINEDSILPGEGIAGNVFASAQPHVSLEFFQDSRAWFSVGPEIPPGWGGACLPIRTVQGIVGVIFVSVRLPRELKNEEVSLLTTLSEIAGNAIHRMHLHESTREQAENLALAYDTTLEGWARALELRDKETEGHTRRVAKMTELLARFVGITEEEIVHIRRGVLLHDIGKMGVPDHILLKPGPLTEQEWKIMRQHPKYSYDMLSSIDFLRPALELPYSHHERWDGTGYPQGLRGEEIPLAARLFAVVDVWDALCSDRPYRPRWTEAAAKKYIRSEAGKSFDPKIVEIFLRLIEKSK